MIALTFQIHLLEPVLVNQLGGGDPNSAIGFDFIPGSAIRGAFIGKYLNGGTVDAADKDFRDLFFDGAVRFLNAYPLTQTKKRTLPTPLSWREEKDVEKDEEYKYTIYDIAIDESFIEENPSKTYEAVKEPFCNPCKEDGCYQTELYKPATQIKIHTARANRQSVADKDSTIFRYYALDSGQIFSSVILADDKSDVDSIATLLPNGTILSLGKSHLAGYGRVRIENVTTEEGWKEYETVGEGAKNTIVVTLVSDAIMRDSESGAHVATIEPRIGIRHKKAFMRTCVRGGFNRTWNLPLPQTLAIRAGSVFVYDDEPELRKRIETLEATGIGERLEEGFGRIAVDWNQIPEIGVIGQTSSQALSATIRGGSGAFAKRIVKRMMQAKLDQTLIEKINGLKIKRGSISNSQLSRMRVVARRAMSEDNTGVIIEQMDHMEKTARDQFQSARIGGTPLGEWLRSLGETPESVWKVFGVDRHRLDELPSLGGIKPELTDDLAREYTVRLIDGVLHKAIEEADNE